MVNADFCTTRKDLHMHPSTAWPRLQPLFVQQRHTAQVKAPSWSTGSLRSFKAGGLNLTGTETLQGSENHASGKPGLRNVAEARDLRDSAHRSIHIPI